MHSHTKKPGARTKFVNCEGGEREEQKNAWHHRKRKRRFLRDFAPALECKYTFNVTTARRPKAEEREGVSRYGPDSLLSAYVFDFFVQYNLPRGKEKRSGALYVENRSQSIMTKRSITYYDYE